MKTTLGTPPVWNLTLWSLEARPRKPYCLLIEATTGYVESAKKIKARPSILNQKTDPEYEKMWANRQTRKLSAKKIFSFGELNIGQSLNRNLVPA